MTMTHSLRRGLIIAGVSLLTVVGLVGVTRHNSTPTATPASLNYAQPAPATAPVDTGAPVVYAVSPFGTAAPAPVVRENFDSTQRVETTPVVARKRAVRRHYYTRSTTGRRVVVKKRPWKHSAAIIGGSAAGGAAIGALAGGGKGAAIGALAGGAGGLIYDRATHKKRVVQ